MPEPRIKVWDEPPRCECNVYAADGSGRVIAWRAWACPLHKPDGWLDRRQRGNFSNRASGGPT